MKIAVTGASGFIGRHLLSVLQEYNVDIFALAREASRLANLHEVVWILDMNITHRAYVGFQRVAEKVKDNMFKFLINAKEEGKSVYAFGAAAKGSTFINFAGIRPDLISAVADSNPAKLEKFMLSSRIPIVSEEILASYKPDYVVILPWNLKEEISCDLSYMRDRGCQFVVGIPELEIL